MLTSPETWPRASRWSNRATRLGPTSYRSVSQVDNPQEGEIFFIDDRTRSGPAPAFANAALHDAQDIVHGLDKDKASVEAAAGKAQLILQDLQAQQAQLVQAAKDAAARQAAEIRAAELAAEARNAAAAAAAFQSSPIIEPLQTTTTHYSGSAAQIAVKVAKDQLGKS